MFLPTYRHAAMRFTVLAVALSFCAFTALADDPQPWPVRPPRGLRQGRTRPIKLRLPLYGPVEPWDPAGPPRPFEEVCFQDRSSLGGLSETEAHRMLEAVKDHGLELSQRVNESTRYVWFRGFGKLHSWLPDSVLRWSISNGSMRIHFWNGKQDIALCYYHDQGRQWAAYRTTWQPTSAPPPKPQPPGLSRMALVATDDRRGIRLEDDTFEARWQEGSIVLTKGDIRLLTAPLEEQPVAVYLESVNGVDMRDLAMCRGGPAPQEPLGSHSDVLGTQALGTLEWSQSVSSTAHFERLPDGSVELNAKKTDAPVMAAIARPSAGPCEIILEIENATIGSGIVLLGEDGKTLQGVEFVWNHNSDGESLEYGQPGNLTWGVDQNADSGIVPAAGPHQWIRIMSAAGMFRCWVSGDGIHWGQILQPQHQTGRWKRLALYIQPSQDNQPGGKDALRRIHLRSLKIRELDGLTKIVPEALRTQALAVVGELFKKHPDNLAAWEWSNQVQKGCPAGADAIVWREACAIDTLAGGPRRELANHVLESLLHDAFESPIPLDAHLRLLQDAAFLVDEREAQEAVRFAHHWDELAHSLLIDGTSADLDLLRRTTMAATAAALERSVEPLDWKLQRDWLLVLLGRQQLHELHQWCNRVNFWHQSIQRNNGWQGEHQYVRRLADWIASGLGGVRVGRDGRKTIAAEMGWQNVAIVPMNRDAYNVISDFTNAADDRMAQDAANVLSAAAQGPITGLVQDTTDVQLFTSYPTAVELLLSRYPEVQEAMIRSFGEPDMLKIRRAIAEGDAAEMEQFALQYTGTVGASVANRWLGDRCLSAGKFGAALEAYEKALATSVEAKRPAIAARIRLASAMLGREAGDPIHEPLAIGNSTIAPDRFEQWVRAMLARNKGDLPAADGPAGDTDLGSPVEVDAKRIGFFGGDLGADSNQIPWRSADSDWPARQIAVSIADDVLLASNRFQLTAFEIKSGKIRWTSGLGANQGPTHAWPLLPMRPVASGERVFARFLSKSGHPLIACIELSTGRKVWEQEGPCDIVSDPLVVYERLLALAVEAPLNQPDAQLMLLELNRRTGDVISKRPLLELQSEWGANQMCQASVVNGRIVAVIAGITLSIESQGRIEWMRSTPALPPSFDLSPGVQYPQPPMPVGGRLYLTQFGSPGIECVDAATGRLVWRRGLPQLRRILGVDDKRVLIADSDSLLAFRADTGATLWRRESPMVFNGYAFPSRDVMICAGQKWIDKGSCPDLQWIDLRSGETLGDGAVPSLHSKRVQFGPMVMAGNHCYSFADLADGQDAIRPQRDLVEMHPSK